jgi:shikimate dehydrogenase
MVKARASTTVIALLGDPVAHSLSPVMQNAAFAAAGLDAVYIALACKEMHLHALMRSLAANGGGGNVTVPHKALAARAAPGDSRVERLGVANVFSGVSGELKVANTDVDGLLAVIASLGTAARRWCVVGTGGSAKAVAGAALEAGAELAVQSRDPGRAAQFREWAVGHGVELAEPDECDLVVNATPLGLHAGDPLPVKLGDFPRLTGVVDLTYRAHGLTGLASAALKRGLAASDGREMLVVQGAAGWRHWFPGVEPPIEVMRAALAGKMA